VQQGQQRWRAGARPRARAALACLLPCLTAGALAAQTPPLDDDAAGEQGRKELAAAVKRSFEGVEPAREVALEERERALGFPFLAVEGAGVRVLAADVREARAIETALGATQALFLELTGVQAAYPAACTAFALSRAEEKNAFLSKHPALTPELRARLEPLDGAGIPGTADWVYWEGDGEQRRDGLVRLACDWFLRESFGVGLERHAWLHEGLSLYLTHALVGTHQTWFVPPRTGSPKKPDDALAELATRLREPDTDWLEEARQAFSSKEKFDLEEVLHLEVNELDARDYLRAYALCAYLVETRAGALPDLLRAVGAGQDARVAVEQAAGAPLRELRVRLGRWLERRSELLAKAEGRRTDAELAALWKRLSGEQKRAAVAGLRARLERLDTGQMRALRKVLTGVPESVPELGDRPFFDPKVHSPGNVIARRRLSASDGRVKKMKKELGLETVEAPGPRRAYVYDWVSGEVRRDGDPDLPETVFQNALLGLPPGADLARALVLARLASPKEAKLQSAFAHAYTDREGNVFPISLFDAWCSGQVFEMPDVDTLGIVHVVLDEWTRWVAPVPATQHDPLYATIGELFRAARPARELREACADVWLQAAPLVRPGYESHVANLHALWTLYDSEPGALSEALPEARLAEGFLRELTSRCKRDAQMSSDGRRRAAGLRQDAVALRRELALALEDAARPPEPASGR